MPPVLPVLSYTIPSCRWRRLHISVASLGVALAVVAASIALYGRLDVQHDPLVTNELKVPGVGAGPEDATYLLQSFKPRIEYGAEDKVSRASQDKDAVKVVSSKHMSGSIGRTENTIASAWISLADRNALVTRHLLTNAKTMVLAVLTVMCICCIGLAFAPAMKEALRRPSEPSIFRRSSYDAPSPEVRSSLRNSLMEQVGLGSGPSPSISSASSQQTDAANLTQNEARRLSLSPSPKPIPTLLRRSNLPRFPPRIGVPLRQVAPFNPNANHEISVVAQRGTPLMWGRVENEDGRQVSRDGKLKPAKRLFELSTNMEGRAPEVTIVSSALGALEIKGGGISFGFLEAERSGRCFIVHQGEYVMVVEGDSGTMDPEITVTSRNGQVARLRCNDAFHSSESEPYIEIGVCPGEDTVLIVAVVLAVMLLSPATWQPG